MFLEFSACWRKKISCFLSLHKRGRPLQTIFDRFSKIKSLLGPSVGEKGFVEGDRRKGFVPKPYGKETF